MQKFIRAAFFEFQQSPARRSAFTTVTKSTVFPMQFVGTRWLENGPVASHLIEMLPQLKKFIEAVESKKVSITKSKSYTVLSTDMKNMKVLNARLQFFVSVCNELEPFLKEFQGNEPLVPFLYDRLRSIFSALFKRFIKASVVDNLATGNDFVKLDLKKSDHHLPTKEVDVGFGARRALGNDTGPDTMAFRAEAKQILIAIGCKLQERSPLKYSMVNYTSCLNPTNIWSDPKQCQRRFVSMCDYLIDAKRVSSSCADKANRSWVKLTSSAEFTSNAKDFAKETNKEKSRLDYFFRTELGDRVEHNDLYEIIKMILVLSHGNAEVERGFSINKNLIRDNLSEESLIAQRLVHQAIPTNDRKFLDVEIDKQMIAGVRMAWRRREQAL